MITRRALICATACLPLGEALLAQKPDRRSPVVTIDDPRYASYAEARRAWWARLGTVDPDVIAYLLSPQFQGLPAWPTTRQSYLVVRRTGSVILASDGLTDLFVDTQLDEPGFGTEVYLETEALAGADFAAIRGSWQFALIENFAQNVADAGGIAAMLERYGVMSMELPAPPGTPQVWVTGRDTVGALINIPDPQRDGRCELAPGVAIAMVPLTLILPDETEYVLAEGAAGRREIAARLLARGTGLASPAERGSVL